jgi:cyclophilin family peptidyl-prolyl cis-trans isomerase
MRKTALFLTLLTCSGISRGAENVQPTQKPGLYAVLDTSEGLITLELYEKYTQIAVKNFVGLATGNKAWYDPKVKGLVKRPMYNGTVFHRVVREQMIQAGDPTGLGTHNCGFTIRDEFLPGLLFDRPGRLGVANTGQSDSGACQFFITDQAMPSWNQHYTVFGQVVEGQDVVTKINRAKVRGEKPVSPVVIKTVLVRRVLAPEKPAR